VKRSTLIALGAIVLLVLVLAWRLQRGRNAEAEARRLAEAETLRQSGLVVVEQAKGKDLDARVRALAAENQALAAALTKANRAAPGSRVVGVASASTGPVKAHGVGGASGAAGGPGSPGPSGNQNAPSSSPLCLLYEGDEGEIQVDEVVLSTKGGNRVLVGTAFAYRTSPLPHEPLFGGEFSAPLTMAAEEKRDTRAGWGGGAFLAAGRHGYAVGPALALPPLRIWKAQIETVAGAGLGPGGEWSGGLSAVVRFR
jgi:hypothetical protein